MSRLQQLAINKEGFVFDPATGESFSVNDVGLEILEGVRAGLAPEEIAQNLSEKFEVETSEAQRDVLDFVDHLRTYRLT